MRKTLTLLVASTGLTAAIAVPVWSAMEAPGDGSLRPFAALVEEAARAMPLVLASDDDDRRDREGSRRGHDDDDDDDDDGEPSGNDVDQNELFMCDGTPAMPPADVRMIDHTEWTRNVGGWYGTNRDRNPLYARADHRYSTYGTDETLDPSVLSLYLGVVGEAGTSWTGWHSYDFNANRTVFEDPETLCFYQEADPSPDCVRYFVTRYLEKGALFRPATDEEIDPLVEYAEARLAEEASSDERTETVSKIGAAAWMTAGALHRTEVGQGELDEHGRLRLSDWELAQAMAYAIGRSAPGVPSVRRKHQFHSKGGPDGYLDGFAVAAEEGTLTDEDTVRDLVYQYIGGLDETRQDLFQDRGDDRDWENRGEYWMALGVRSFFREWLGYETPGRVAKVEVSSTSHWSGFEVDASYGNTLTANNGYENTLTEHMDDMIARIVADDSDVLAQLLTSRTFYTPATANYQEGVSNVWKTTSEMNRVYNVQGVTEHTREDRWIELPDNERAGVLTHPAWLGAHGLATENDPALIHRGKWVREELLCQNVPPLPLTVDAALSEDTLEDSARSRVSEQIDSDPACTGCHDSMNPLGYPFEIYNHAGFLRAEDHGGPPDGSSMLKNMPTEELSVNVGSAIEMSELFAQSQWVKRCFIRQTFRYFVGREETIQDRCTFVALEETYDSSGGSMAELLTTLFTSDSFQYRVPN